jgi:hypothetical protein
MIAYCDDVVQMPDAVQAADGSIHWRSSMAAYACSGGFVLVAYIGDLNQHRGSQWGIIVYFLVRVAHLWFEMEENSTDGDFVLPLASGTFHWLWACTARRFFAHHNGGQELDDKLL